MTKNLFTISFVAASLALAACTANVENADPNPTPADLKQGEGLFSGKTGNILDGFRKDEEGARVAALPVNQYIWRAALEAISFMPLAEVDSAGGVITTDWVESPENAKERVKVNVLVLSRDLRPQSLKVTVFRQLLAGSTWQNAENSASTARQLEETILTNARALRVKETLQ